MSRVPGPLPDRSTKLAKSGWKCDPVRAKKSVSRTAQIFHHAVKSVGRKLHDDWRSMTAQGFLRSCQDRVFVPINIELDEIDAPDPQSGQHYQMIADFCYRDLLASRLHEHLSSEHPLEARLRLREPAAAVVGLAYSGEGPPIAVDGIAISERLPKMVSGSKMFSQSMPR
jgi:hypothetical protein